ncbi:unnamed protein product [Pylaiella littoralis]
MKGRVGGSEGGGHGAAGGASSSGRRGGGGGDGHDRGDHGGRDGEGKLRIHLKRSCTERKLVQGDTGLGLTTDDWQKFKRLLASKTFAVHDTKRIRGENLTAAWAAEGGFREPVIAPDKSGLGLKVPEPSFTVADVARVVGEDKAIRPIHVGEQANIDQSMTLAEFAEYFETCTRPGQAILNMISLEFSDTPLAGMVQSPQLVRDMDLLHRCWPEGRKNDGEFPKVQYYCLMSQGGSYTDFHVDFGGTSVWYHILRGKKEFLLIRPTKKNLELYEGWIRSPTQSQIFFGDLADTCYRVVLNAGETLMIPSGWIHAVFTPKPSLVFGGNFLHSLNLPMQLQIHDIEVRAKTAAKFRFPYFKEMMLFTASAFLRTLRTQQGEVGTTSTTTATASAGGGSTSASYEETTLEEGNTAAVAAKKESEALGPRGEGATAAAAAAVATASAQQQKDANNGAGVWLGSWERQGLRPLLEACREWLEPEEEGSDEDDVPEEWHLAATMAGCGDVNEMLVELDLRVSALEEGLGSMKVVSDSPSAPPSQLQSTTPPSDGATPSSNADRSDAPLDGAVCGSPTDAAPSSIGGGEAKGSEQPDAGAGAAGAAAGGAAALLLAAAAAATTIETEDGGGAEEAATTPPRQAAPDSMVAATGCGSGFPRAATAATATAAAASTDCGGDDERGARSSRPGGNTEEKPLPAVAAAASSLSCSIPKLKISLKPQPQVSSSPRAPGSGPTKAGLKLVLKGPALSSARHGAGAGSRADVRGGSESSSGKKRQRQQQERRYKEDYEGSDEHEVRDSSDAEEDDDGDDDGEEEDEEEEEEEEEEEDEESGDDTRVGRGAKRRARPLGSRLRAIARLGDDAAAGGSDDDNSADEYKPEDADDDFLPEDHKIYADELPRELKKGKVGPGGGGGGGGRGGRQGNAWNGFGGGGGSSSGSSSSSSGSGSGSAGWGAGGRSGRAGGRGNGVPAGRAGAIAGVRRLSVTKQEALRSKGVFKIAPPSKVPVKKPGDKVKKPLTAKQKLLAKMRR